MSGIFLCVLLFCGAFGLMTGRGEALGLEVLAAGEDAVQLGLSLAGAYMVWSGLLSILERAGAVRALSRAPNPGDILLPALIGSAASTLCAVALGKLCERLWPA